MNVRLAPALLLAMLMSAVSAQPAAADWYVVKYKPGAHQQGGSFAAVRSLRVMPDLNAVRVKVPRGDERRFFASVRARDDVQYVERDVRRRYLWRPSDRYTTTSPRARRMQWWIPRIRADQAWNEHGVTTGESAWVAVVDSGVDTFHPDLAGQVFPGFNSLVRRTDSYAKGFVSGDNEGHGTHIAGVVGALSDNSIGIAGVAPRSVVIPVKISNDVFGPRASSVARGVRWATDRGADVINLSLGSRYPSRIEREAIRYARARQVLVVCAAGNSGKARLDYPAGYPECLSVGASTPRDTRAGFSSYGRGLDLVAPGVSIVSTTPGGYARYDGTSMAAPVVSGVAALLADRGVKGSAARHVLTRTAKDLGPRGRDNRTGWGRVDALAAVRAVAPKAKTANRSPKCLVGTFYFVPGTTMRIGLNCWDPNPDDTLSYTLVSPSPTAGGARIATDPDFAHNGAAIFVAGTSSFEEVIFQVTDGVATTTMKIDMVRQPPFLTIRAANQRVKTVVKARVGSSPVWLGRKCTRVNRFRVKCQVAFASRRYVYAGTLAVWHERRPDGIYWNNIFEGERFRTSCFVRNGTDCRSWPDAW